jgi:purine-nucleoside phosphorylase
MSLWSHLEETLGYLRPKIATPPEVAIILGSGLGPLADELEVELSLPYSEIPHFPLATAPGHEGRLLIGRLAGTRVLMYKGRVHVYEGYSPAQVAYPAQVGRLLGAQTFFVTSAAGGLNPHWNAGDLMLHLDYINYSGLSPLTGPNEERLGPRFPVTFGAYDAELQALARQVARKLDLNLKEGVYLWWPGPQFGSRAELRMLRGLGADALGMSTVPEVIALCHLKTRILGLSLITDMALPDRDHHADEAEVLAVAERAGESFRKLVRGLLAHL